MATKTIKLKQYPGRIIIIITPNNTNRNLCSNNLEKEYS